MEIDNAVQTFTDAEILNIRNIKLTNGDDIIGVILSYSDQVMVIKRPSKIVNVQRDESIGNHILMMNLIPLI